MRAAGGHCSILALTIDMLSANSEKVLEMAIAPALTAMYKGCRPDEKEQDHLFRVTRVANVAIKKLGLPASARAECVCNDTPSAFMDVSSFQAPTTAPFMIELPRGLDAQSNLRSARARLHGCTENQCGGFVDSTTGRSKLLLCDLATFSELHDTLSASAVTPRGVMLTGDVLRCRMLAYEICSSQLHGGHFSHVYHLLTAMELDEFESKFQAADDMHALLWVDGSKFPHHMESGRSLPEVRDRSTSHPTFGCAR